MLGVMDGFDDVLVIAGKVKETTRFSRRAQLGQDIFGGQRYKVICRVKLEVLAKMAKDPGRVVLEFEVVLGRRSEFVSGTVSDEPGI